MDECEIISDAAKLKQKVLSGLFWRGFDQFGTQAVQFLVSVVLARLLMPKDFGLAALLLVFIALAQVVVDGGFGSALIQKRDADAIDYCSVFFLSIGVGICLYLACFLAAPLFGALYGEPELVPLLRVLGLSLLLGALNGVQNAILTREMRFRRNFLVNIVGILIYGCAGISLARCGWGVWSLVGAQLASALGRTGCLWLGVSWRPEWRFSWDSVRQMFRFGSRWLGSQVLTWLYVNMFTLVIGKLFLPATLGFYTRGYGFAALLMLSVSGTISAVMFPALSSCQADPQEVKRLLRRANRTSAFALFPLLAIVAVTAKPLIVLLYTAKWLPAVPFLQVSCLTVAFWPMIGANGQGAMALGRSDMLLRLEIINRIAGVVVLVATVPFGIMAMVIGQAVHSAVIAVGVYTWANRTILAYTFREQIGDILPAFCISLGMVVVILPIAHVVSNTYMLIGMQGVVGSLVYLSLCKLAGLDSPAYLVATARQMLGSWRAPKGQMS